MELQRQLAALTGAEAPSVRTSIASHLSTLDQLRAAIASGKPVSLAEINAATSGARSAVQQAQAATANASLAESEHASQAAQKRTAELDKLVAGTMEADRTNNALAHAMAKRYGVDLTDLDAQREDLERQLREAKASGDKDAERHLQTLISKNTDSALEKSEPFVTDPGERSAFEKTRTGEKKIVDLRASAETEQQGLNATLADDSKLTKPADASQSASFALTLDGGSTIALSDKPDAHTTVETPPTKFAVAASGAVRS